MIQWPTLARTDQELDSVLGIKCQLGSRFHVPLSETEKKAEKISLRA